MPAPRISPERRQRIKNAIEAALRDGYRPYRSEDPESKGSCITEAARRLTEAGYTKDTERALRNFIYAEEKAQRRGFDHYLPDWTIYAAPGKPVAAIRPGAVYRWLLTAAQDDTDVHRALWTNIQVFAKYLDAQIMVAPFTYQTRWHTDRDTQTAQYRPELLQHLRWEAIDCGPALFAANVNILPTAVKPFSGMETYGKGRDTIFGHAKQQMVSVAQLPGDYVPLVMTTGAVTVPNYIAKKAGQKAEFHHSLGFVLAEADGDGNVFCWQISATPDGTFQHHDIIVEHGRISRGNRVKAIVHGDIHFPYINTEIVEGVWAREPGSMIEALRPQYQFYHDLHDFRMWSRHVRGDPHHKAELWFQDATCVEKQMAGAARFLRETERDWCRSVVVGSNHPERLKMWAKDKAIADDPENAMFWHQCNVAWHQAAQNVDEDFDLVLWAMRQADTQGLAGIDYVPVRNGSFRICQDVGGIECGLHGHLGANGARSSPATMAKLGVRIVHGDFHRPYRLDGATGVGILCDRDQGYNTGPGSWRLASAVIYPNGKVCILPISDEGKWRAV